MWWALVGHSILQQFTRPDKVFQISRDVERISNLISEKRNEDPTRNLFRANFDIIETLGSGSYGIVFKVKKTKPDEAGWVKTLKNFLGNPQQSSELEFFAVKMIPCHPEENQEIINLSCFIHQNIVTYYYAWDEKFTAISAEDREYFRRYFPSDYLNYSCDSSDSFGTKWDHKFGPEMNITFIFQELCDQGTLADKLVQWESEIEERNLQVVKSLFFQIVQGLAYLKQKGVVHRDLRPPNIFVIKQNDELVVKVGDFGLSQAPDLPNPNSDFSQTNLFHSGVRKWYQSPEQLHQHLYTHKGDIYALGLIYMTMLHPFNSETERRLAIWKMMEEDDHQQFPSDFESTFPQESQLILQMVSYNLESRPSASEILGWISERDNSVETPTDQQMTYKKLKSLVETVQQFNNPTAASILSALNIPIPPGWILKMSTFYNKSEYSKVLRSLLELFERLDARGKTYLFQEFARIRSQAGSFSEDDLIDYATLKKMLDVSIATVGEGHINSVRITEGRHQSP